MPSSSVVSSSSGNSVSNPFETLSFGLPRTFSLMPKNELEFQSSLHAYPSLISFSIIALDQLEEKISENKLSTDECIARLNELRKEEIHPLVNTIDGIGNSNNFPILFWIRYYILLSLFFKIDRMLLNKILFYTPDCRFEEKKVSEKLSYEKVINLCEEAQRTSGSHNQEIYWYYGLALYEKAKLLEGIRNQGCGCHIFKNRSQVIPKSLIESCIKCRIFWKEVDCHKLTDCLEKLESDWHRDVMLYIYFREYYEKIPTNPNYELYKKAMRFNRLGRDFTHWFSERCHTYSHQIFVNKRYQNFHDPSIIDPNFRYRSLEIPLVIHVGNTINTCDLPTRIEIKENKLEKLLFRFMAHLVPPTRPRLEFEFSNLSPDINHKLNEQIKQNLARMKIYHPLGYIDKEHIDDQTKKLKPSSCKEIERIISEVLHQNKMTIKDIKVLLDRINECATKVCELEKIRKKLSGLATNKALGLMYQSLSYSKPTNLSLGRLIEKAKILVGQCLQIAEKLQSIGDNDEAIFNFSEHLVSYLRQGRNLLLPTGKVGHRVYTFIKYSNTQKHYRIYISNGGNGVSFHKKAHHLPDEIPFKYYFFLSAPFHLDHQSKRANLQHYLYRLFKSYNINSETVMFDIYFCQGKNPKGGFYGYNQEGNQQPPLIKLLEGINPEKESAIEQKTFTEQWTGNCNIHNLVNSFKILIDEEDMEGIRNWAGDESILTKVELTYQLLMDTILDGFDRYSLRLGINSAKLLKTYQKTLSLGTESISLQLTKINSLIPVNRRLMPGYVSDFPDHDSLIDSLLAIFQWHYSQNKKACEISNIRKKLNKNTTDFLTVYENGYDILKLILYGCGKSAEDYSFEIYKRGFSKPEIHSVGQTTKRIILWRSYSFYRPIGVAA